MRLSVLSVPLLLALTTSAHAPRRRNVTTDTCANIDADLVFPDVSVDGKPYNAGHIHLSVCIAQVDKFIDHYDVTVAAAKVVDHDRVRSAIIDLIEKAGVQCTYPTQAIPSPMSSDPCDFVCGEGYLAVPPDHPSSCISHKVTRHATAGAGMAVSGQDMPGMHMSDEVPRSDATVEGVSTAGKGALGGAQSKVKGVKVRHGVAPATGYRVSAGDVERQAL